ncbi:MAG: glycosyltransferase family 4 protein [Candidatus Aenigmarchaeota archaeon]|nr:glycosyltransferase family 4 protein [Candidatus Aenigmarchaeota archaeon]
MKISVLVYDLSTNSIVRTYPIVRVLQRRHEVEVIGPVFGEGVFPPYAGEFDYRTVRGRSMPLFALPCREMLRKITGDVVYAFKPKATSYGVGFLKKVMDRKPVVLDVEDWEISSWYHPYSRRSFVLSMLSLWKPNSLQYLLLMHFLAKLADDVTVVSSFLQKRYGGSILPHGADTGYFDPARYDREEMRSKLGIGDGKIILFSGTARPMKGIEHILEALRMAGRDDIRLLMVGDIGGGYLRSLQGKYGSMLMHAGKRPHSEMPSFLAAADMVVLPQRRTPYNEAQVPGKIFEALAMGKPVIGSSVSDIPGILDECGIVVEPDDTRALAEAIMHVAGNDGEARRMGAKARKKCVSHYSWDAMERILAEVFGKFE